MDVVLELLQQHWPVIFAAGIVPGLKWIKNKAKTDWPILWWVVSIGTSVGLALGGGEIAGEVGLPVDQAAAQLNAVMTAALTQLIHTSKKTAEKVNGQ